MSNFEKFRKLVQLPPKIKLVLNNLSERNLTDFDSGFLRWKDYMANSKDPQYEPKMTDKGVYFGRWDKIKGKFHGFGVLYSPEDKTYYEGFFLNGEKNGKGRLISADGELKEGDWKNGKFVLEAVNGNKVPGLKFKRNGGNSEQNESLKIESFWKPVGWARN